MKGKLFILLIVIAAFSLWNHRNKNFTHDKYLHYPTLKVYLNLLRLTLMIKMRQTWQKKEYLIIRSLLVLHKKFKERE